MKAVKPTFVLLLFLFFAISALAQGSAGAWTLQDQFGKSADVRVGVGRTVLVIVSDTREAADEIDAWEKLLGTLPAAADVYRIANLKAIPFFVPKGSVMKDLKEKYPGMSLLLDWKGSVSSELKAPMKTVAVLVFGPDGAELGRVVGAASVSGAEKVKENLARAK